MDDPKLLDVVELTAPADGWPAGTTGTLVEAFDSAGFVEVADENGVTLGMPTVPYTALRVIWRAPVYDGSAD